MTRQGFILGQIPTLDMARGDYKRSEHVLLMGKGDLPKPVVDEKMMAALEDYFYKTFWEDMNKKEIETKGLKGIADKCESDSPLREVLMNLPDKISKFEMLGLFYPLETLAKREDRIRSRK